MTSIEMARKISARIKPCRRWTKMRLDQSQVPQRRMNGEGFELIGEPRHDWRDLQRIKNDLVGEEWEAIELFPAESRLLDPSNYYTLYCAPKIAIGLFEPRRIILPKDALAPQRGWEPGHEPKDAVRINLATKQVTPAQ